MTNNESDQILRLLAGHWPNPQISEDEVRVWKLTLLPLNAKTAREVLDRHSAQGSPFRPTDGMFVRDYRQAIGREPRVYTNAPELEETTERITREEMFARSRATLRGEKATA